MDAWCLAFLQGGARVMQSVIACATQCSEVRLTLHLRCMRCILPFHPDGQAVAQQQPLLDYSVVDQRSTP